VSVKYVQKRKLRANFIKTGVRECSKMGQQAFHEGPSKQKPAPIFVLVD
jgi:hypothetical protein